MEYKYGNWIYSCYLATWFDNVTIKDTNKWLYWNLIGRPKKVYYDNKYFEPEEFLKYLRNKEENKK